MPAWNEEAVIEAAVRDLEREVLPAAEDVEIVVVDDRSSDRTGEILDRLGRESSHLRVIHAEANAGHGPSVLRAIRESTGDWIFQLDSDRQIPIEEFRRLWEHAQTADLALGVRRGRRDPPTRLALTRVVATVVSLLARRRIRDANVPFKVFRRELWNDLRPLIAEDALAPSIFIALGAARRGWRIAEVPVAHVAGVRTRSSLRAWRLLSFAARGLAQLIAFNRKLSQTPRTHV